MKIPLLIFTLGVLVSSGLVTGAEIGLSDQYEFLIITPSDFLEELVPLKNHKEAHGISTKIITLDDIYNGVYFPVTGRDDAEQIKYFLKNAQENWSSTFVMLVGGKDEVPVRYAVLRPYNSTNSLSNVFFHPLFTPSDNSFITDVYYADIYDENGSFCSWDSNENDVFGEIGLDGAIDDVDLYPDMFIGRVLCHTSEDVETIVGKIIVYENSTYGQEWFFNLILCGGDTHPNTWEEILLGLMFKQITGERYRFAWEGEYMSEMVAEYMDSFTAKKYYASSLLGIRAKRLTLRNMNQALDDGAGFVLFNFHGSPTGMVTYPPFNKKKSIPMPRPSGYDISNIQTLTNDDKLPIIVFSACSCGDFDIEYNPLAWEFVRYEHGGGIASFALTTAGNIYPSTACIKTLTGHTTLSVFEVYANGIDTLGEVWGETISRYLDDEWAWSINQYLVSNGESVIWLNYLAVEEWILFGDPTLKIGGYP
jgi:hypothetical protein